MLITRPDFVCYHHKNFQSTDLREVYQFIKSNSNGFEFTNFGSSSQEVGNELSVTFRLEDGKHHFPSKINVTNIELDTENLESGIFELPDEDVVADYEAFRKDHVAKFLEEVKKRKLKLRTKQLDY